MNTFGHQLRISVYGESHGAIMGVTLDGVPSGITLCENDFENDISRRKPGAKGTTPRIEEDRPILATGVFNGYTTGAPLTILFENKNTRSTDYDKTKDIYRPGHADFVAQQKFSGFQDYRGSGHFSGRLTLLFVAAGVVAKKIIEGISIEAKIISIGGEQDIEAGLQKAIDQKDSVGGIIECRCTGVPIGLGEPLFDSLESALAHAMFSIPAIKGVEFGSGFSAAEMFGSEHNDRHLDGKGTTASNNAGGIIGGISNGNDLVFRVAVKPTSSIGKEQETWNFATNEMDTLRVKGRHDLCIALRVPVIVEAMAAIVLVDMKRRLLNK
jgi:chorismate synthase